MNEYTPELRSTLSLLITANHVLSHYGLVDAVGHVSVRSPNDPSTFFMTGNAVPSAVSSESDLAHYRVSDATPVLAGDVHSTSCTSSERYMHSEIYLRYPGVRAVVFSHARDVLVAGVSGVPVRPMCDMAGFLGSHVPVFDIADTYVADEKDDGNYRPRHMLVNSPQIGARFAEAFDGSTMDADVEGPRVPQRTVVLQRGHGFTTWGESIQEAVYRAYWTQENVRIQIAATDHSIVSLGEIATTPLSKEEIRDTAATIKPLVFKFWQHWSRVVGAEPLYRNDLSGTKASDEAQKFWRSTLHNRMMPF